MKKLILIDAHALIHRVYHALPRLSSPKGELINAVYGFSSILIKILKELKPDYILAAFDLPGPTFRHEEYKEYKATRVKAPDELYQQIPKIKEILNAFGIAIYEKNGFEADDIIGTIIEKIKKEKLKIQNIIASGDLDTLQLIDKNTKVFVLKKGITETIIYDDNKVFERYGLKPEQLIDFKALKGDPSDNIPGVKGIGEKTAINLLKKFGTLENLYQEIEKEKAEIPQSLKEKLLANKKEAFFSKYLATIRRDTPIDFDLKNCQTKKIDKTKIISIFKNLGFFSLIKRLEENKDFQSKSDLLPNNSVGNNSVSLINKKVKINLLKSLNEFNNLIKKANKNKLLSIYFDKEKDCIEFSSQKNEIYVLNIGNAIEENKKEKKNYKNLETIKKITTNTEGKKTKNFNIKFLKELEFILANKEIKKIGYDLKTIFKYFLKNYGIWIEELDFDLMIAEHLLNPDVKNYILDKFFFKYLSIDNSTQLSTKANYIIEIKQILENKLKELGLFEIFKNIEMPLICVLAQIELIGIKIDENYFKKLNYELEQKLKHIEDKIYDFVGFKFNINSPQQLTEVLFDKLKISAKGIKKTGKTKRLSTQASELLKLKGRHQIIDLILEYREIVKIKNTYINSLVKLRNPINSRVFGTFSQVGTATGRLASFEPNLQNLPKKTELGRKVRAGFIAENKYNFISFDYSQIELRIVASLANDQKMIQAFNEGKDIHKMTAAQIFNVKENEVTNKMRDFAKMLNFGILYGMSARSLAQSASMSQEEALRFIDEYFLDFNGVAKFVEETKEKAKQSGFVKNLLNRVRYLPDIFSTNLQVQRAAERIAVNMPIQSLAADIIKMAMIEIFKTIDEKTGLKERLKNLFKNNLEFKNHNLPIVFVLQVHDELVFEAKKEIADDLIFKIKEIMENIIKLKVPLVVDYKIGKNLADLE